LRELPDNLSSELTAEADSWRARLLRGHRFLVDTSAALPSVRRYLIMTEPQIRCTDCRARWQVVGERFAPLERLGGEGLSCHIHTLANGFQTAVVTLPEARGPAEAQMVAIVYRRSRRPMLLWKTKEVIRYFTLELAHDRAADEWLNMLCEWTRDGHINRGKGPATDVTAFVGAIQELLTPNRLPPHE
jgi:hypothetical protein